MFERFTEGARRILFFARYEASQARSLSIEPSHLLLGLMREKAGVTQDILARAGLTIADIQPGADAAAAPGERTSSVEIPFSAAAKRVLKRTATGAEGLGHAHIGPEHLLLALPIEDAGILALLTSRGVSVDEIREAAREAPPVRVDRLVSTQGRTRDGRPGRPAGKPNITPSYTVNIQTSAREHGTSSTAGPSWLVLSGFTLRAALAHLYEVGEHRVVLPPETDTRARYDIACVLPDGESHPLASGLIVQAIERRFSLELSFEAQMMEAYVMSADPSPTRRVEPGGFSAFVGDVGLEAPVLREEMLSLFTDILRASAGIAAGAMAPSGEAYVNKTCELPEFLLQRVRARFGILIEPAKREGLLVVAVAR